MEKTICRSCGMPIQKMKILEQIRMEVKVKSIAISVIKMENF